MKTALTLVITAFLIAGCAARPLMLDGGLARVRAGEAVKSTEDGYFVSDNTFGWIVYMLEKCRLRLERNAL